METNVSQYAALTDITTSRVIEGPTRMVIVVRWLTIGTQFMSDKPGGKILLPSLILTPRTVVIFDGRRFNVWVFGKDDECDGA